MANDDKTVNAKIAKKARESERVYRMCFLLKCEATEEIGEFAKCAEKAEFSAFSG